jgi:hypothetical protein
MRTQHVGALVVTAPSGERPVAVGILTDRDLALEVLSRDLPSGEVAVSAVASRQLVAVPASASMTAHGTPGFH